MRKTAILFLYIQVEMDKQEKILISGTGRCGTTFLIKIFSFLGMDTGFTLDNYEKAIFKNCNAGMERKIDSEYTILKNPNFIKDINEIVKTVTIKHMIIPIRNFDESAESRERNGKWGIGMGCQRSFLTKRDI
jgi:hypothetical protein